MRVKIKKGNHLFEDIKGSKYLSDILLNDERRYEKIWENNNNKQSISSKWKIIEEYDINKKKTKIKIHQWRCWRAENNREKNE